MPDIIPYFNELVEKYGPRTKYFVGWVPNAVVASAEDIEVYASFKGH